ncbi:MAG: EamA family transporter, partial [Planctomycetota bacterium]
PTESALLGNALTFLIGAPFLIARAPAFDADWLGVVFLGVFQLGVSYVFFTKAIRHVSALDGILVPVIEPVLNPIWVYLVIGETMETTAIGGAALVIGMITWRSAADRGNESEKEKLTSSESG